MPRWRNSYQKKEQEKVMARDLIKAVISNMLDPEFKATIIRTLAGLEKSIEDNKESLTAGMNDLKTSQAKMKNAITKIQH